jgi:hypothetical protein
MLLLPNTYVCDHVNIVLAGLPHLRVLVAIITVLAFAIVSSYVGKPHFPCFMPLFCPPQAIEHVAVLLHHRLGR